MQSSQSSPLDRDAFVSLSGRVPVNLKRRLKTYLAAHQLTYNDWLKYQITAWLDTHPLADPGFYGGAGEPAADDPF